MSPWRGPASPGKMQLICSAIDRDWTSAPDGRERSRRRALALKMGQWTSPVAQGLVDSTWLYSAAAFALLGLLLVLGSLVALLRLRPFRFLWRLLAGMVALLIGMLAALVAIGTAGYRALTHETIAVTVRVEPTAPQRFRAIVRLPDGREAIHELAGDEFYIDAHILKWKPVANLVGLHTAYELDRIAGRYHSVKDEQQSLRTVIPLRADKPVDLFTLRQRYAVLAPLVDAQYGSASFVPVTRPAELEVRVSTTGLLIREQTR